jgi:hypothetical protein
MRLPRSSLPNAAAAGRLNIVEEGVAERPARQTMISARGDAGRIACGRKSGNKAAMRLKLIGTGATGGARDQSAGLARA